MTTRLPPELLFYIIDFLRNDKAALSACILCCSAFATVARPLLFHTLRTTFHSKAADRFDHILESDPTILPLVKRIDVTISAFKPGADTTIMTISRIMTRCHAQYTSPALNIVIRPTRLYPDRLMETILSFLGPVVDWVTSLVLDRLDFAECMQFWDLILAFRMLKSLVLRLTNVLQEGDYIPSHPESTIPISHLSLKAPLGNICGFLADRPISFPSLTSLDVRLVNALDQVPVRFGRHYGPIVRTLRFGVVTLRHSTEPLNQILDPTTEFISQFRNLEALTFQGLFVPSAPIQQHPITFEWIPIVLCDVSPTVRKFTMELVANQLSHLDVVPWSAIDEIFSHELRSVNTVEILLATPFGKNRLLDSVYQDMEKKLPLAAQRGVLRCSAVAEHPI